MIKRFLMGFIAAALSLFVSSTPLFPEVSAQEDGGDIVFKDTKKFNPVLFSHAKHKEAGNVCTDCHTNIFQQKAGSTDEGNALTMKSMMGGKFCGTCHNGKTAFKVMSACKKCHSVSP